MADGPTVADSDGEGGDGDDGASIARRAHSYASLPVHSPMVSAHGWSGDRADGSDAARRYPARYPSQDARPIVGLPNAVATTSAAAARHPSTTRPDRAAPGPAGDAVRLIGASSKDVVEMAGCLDSPAGVIVGAAGSFSVAQWALD